MNRLKKVMVSLDIYQNFLKSKPSVKRAELYAILAGLKEAQGRINPDAYGENEVFGGKHSSFEGTRFAKT